MATSHTAVTIRNHALDLIGEYPLTTVDDNNVYARWLNRNFQHYVQAALRQQPWNFACDFFTLTSVDEMTFRWEYAFDLPSGWLRVLPVTVDGERDGAPVPHEVKKNRLYASYAATQNIECVMDTQAPGDWDPLFAELITARLALGMANRFTGKNSYVTNLANMAVKAYDNATEINTFEGSQVPTEEFNIIRVRG